MQLSATLRQLQKIQGGKNPEVWAHLAKAIYFTVNFFLLRTCPNSLMIQFMANTFQPITSLWKGWSSLPYPHTASKLTSRDGPSAHLLLASCHLHPSTPHPAPAPKEWQAQCLPNRLFSQQDSQERTRTHEVTNAHTSQCKSQQKPFQNQDRWVGYIH